MTQQSVVALWIGFEIREHIDGTDNDIVIILRGIRPTGALGGYKRAQDLPKEYRRALLPWLQEAER
jgi:hypothetical protein